MKTPGLSLNSLPPELILCIRDYLPPDGILALKLTNRPLFNTLPLDSCSVRGPLSGCARLAVRAYLSKPNPSPSHLRCILCKSIYPANMFESSNSPAVAPTLVSNAEQTDVLELPERLCLWHVGRFARAIPNSSEGSNKWVCTVDKMCMHCGNIQGWAKCSCRCDSCPFRVVKSYTRYSNNDNKRREFKFYRKVTRDSVSSTGEEPHTSLWVREVYRNPSKPHVLELRKWAHETPIFETDCCRYA